MDYEYGIAHYKHDPNEPEPDGGPHRLDMPLEEARTWLEEWKQMGGNSDAFYLIRRPRGPWEAFEDDPSTDLPNPKRPKRKP